MDGAVDELGELRRQGLYAFDVFLSYSGAHEERAENLYQRLSNRGLTVFFSPVSLEPDNENPGQFVLLLQAALIRSAQAVVLLNPAYLKSAWCILEINAALACLGEAKPQRLWILPEGRVDAELMGQAVPFVWRLTDDELAERIVAASRSVGVGDPIPDGGRSKPFSELPLRRFYEPPTAGNRPPWRKDSRSPHGLPAGPSYEEYEMIVREYMVQIARGWNVDRLTVRGTSDHPGLRGITTDARRDAEQLATEGFSPTQRRGTRSLADWLRDLSAARAEGQPPEELDALEGRARTAAGQLEEAEYLLRSVLARATDKRLVKEASQDLALALYLGRKPEKALAELNEQGLSETLLAAACRARLGLSTAYERAKNAASGIVVDDLRVSSDLVRRAHVDYWAEGLELAGYIRGRRAGVDAS